MRYIVSTLLILCLSLSFPCEGMAKTKGKKKAAATTSSSTDNDKYASIIMDASTGVVLSETNADKPLHPASLTKVMTLMLLFESMENGNVRLNDRLLVSQRAASQQPSKLGLEPGASIRVEDAILSVVTKSANDMAVAIAENLAGSEDRFAERMTRRAHDIGMTRTYFRNASGLHNPGQVTTARDMATLARYVLVRYPNYYRYFGTKQFTYRGKTMTNHNRLMLTYPGMDGFKTGFINQSGFNLIASAKHGDTRLIGVVFGGKSTKSRNDTMAGLLNNGFDHANDIRYAKGQAVPIKGKPVEVVNVADAKPMPLPAAKPALQDMAVAQVPAVAAPANTLQLPSVVQQTQNFTSLSSLDTGRKLVVPQNTQQLDTQAPAIAAVQPAAEPPEPDVTAQAVASVETAINRGDYSELTGEGDYDPGTTRRVETGLLSAAVYKGEHEKARKIQLASATQSAVAIAPSGVAPQSASADQNSQPVIAAMPVALPPDDAQAPAASDLWSVQIGAYTSRVATDDALRLAAAKLPAGLSSYARPIAVPLKTSEGILFRARLGGFTQAQAVEACRYYHDCLPVAPRTSP